MAKAAQGRRQFVDPDGNSSDAFRGLHLALELRSDLRRGNAIVFTSPGPREGKSTIAANYALVAARQHRVLLIDADFRNPSLHEFFGVPRSPGLIELLGMEAQLGKLTHQIPSIGHLDLLPVGSLPPSVGDIAASSLMATLLARARSAYDVVVIDAPPVLVAADASALAVHPGTDVVVVVKRSGRRRPLLRALRRLDLIHASVLGLVVNRDDRVAAYGYS